MQNVSTGRVKLTRESNNSQDKQSVHTTSENDKCKLGFKHLFYNKMHTTGSYLMLSFRARINRIRADATSLKYFGQ
jgi:hypothetical protein